jgi:mersacidin/lichenicidin family type 2 lantibiotic
MSNKQIIRAWKDPVFRNSLSTAQRVSLPAHPAGSVELSAEDLGAVAGAKPIELPPSVMCPTMACTPFCSWVVCQA